MFITVGTDHHPFDRIVEWADELALLGGADVVVQYGNARPPSVAQGYAYLPHVELTELIRSSQVVVCHGGPATIMQVRDAGKRPLAVARDPSLGEHVDSHQQRFVARIGTDRKVLAINSLGELLDTITAVRSGELSLATAADEPDLNRVVELFGDLVDALVAARRSGVVK